ncbi:GerAB/ArcD/ProY family transporter [Clostridium ganghwense]|uniref:Endospore germination permease n=1 Tax=Clostridium ganghwense TaxID=312089 RepID=A0ABT4CJ45_9CLOT|nr:endospore germination permease [Clostridium ganghwense]MCY6369064.1 endospore germination permease [Clostridium ganghwense]
MKKEVISDRQAISMVCMFTIGTAMIYGAARPAEENAWISIILAALISIPFQLMYGRLLSHFHSSNFFEFLDIIFGKILGKFFAVLFTWNAVYLASILFRAVGEFISIAGLDDTPEMLSLSLIVVLSILTLKEGVKPFAKWCEFFIVIVFIVVGIMIIFLTKLINLDNIVPIMYDGVKPVMQGTIYALGFPFTQDVIFLMFFDCLKNNNSCYKVLIKGVLLGTIVLFSITFLDISILGKSDFSKAYFPSYMSLRRLTVGEFFQRIEIAVILIFMIVGFAKITSTLFAAVKGISHLFNVKDYRTIAAPVTFLASILGYLAYTDTMDQKTFLKDVYVPYAIIIQIVLTSIVFIVSEIRIRKLEKNNDL